MSLEELLAVQNALLLQQCWLEGDYEVDNFLQQMKQGVVAYFMPPPGDARRVTVLDVEVAPQSLFAQQCALERWLSPQIDYVVSTSADPVLKQVADGTKVIFKPYQLGQPVVDASQEYNRFHLINAIFSLDQLRALDAGGDALTSFMLSCGQILLPGGHLLCSVRATDARVCQLIVNIASYCGLTPLTTLPYPMNLSFSVYDVGAAYKRLNLYPSNQCLDEYNTQLAYLHYFIVFTRS